MDREMKSENGVLCSETLTAHSVTGTVSLHLMLKVRFTNSIALILNATISS